MSDDVIIKTPSEIDSMRQGGHLLGTILQELGQAVEPGKTPLDVEHRAEELFAHYDVIPGFKGYHGYPSICCISVNEELVHGIPSDERPFKKGDLVKIDCGLILDSLNTDSAISVFAGGEETASEKARQLSDITKKALNLAIKLVKPGTKLGDLGYIIQQTVENAGFSIVRDLTGHGVGHALHEGPTIYNFGKKGTGIALKPGMTIAIEPITAMGDRFMKTLEDRWTIVTRDGSLGCQWEHTVLVTDHGHEVLTIAG